MNSRSHTIFVKPTKWQMCWVDLEAMYQKSRRLTNSLRHLLASCYVYLLWSRVSWSRGIESGILTLEDTTNPKKKRGLGNQIKRKHSAITPQPSMCARGWAIKKKILQQVDHSRFFIHQENTKVNQIWSVTITGLVWKGCVAFVSCCQTC